MNPRKVSAFRRFLGPLGSVATLSVRNDLYEARQVMVQDLATPQPKLPPRGNFAASARQLWSKGRMIAMGFAINYNYNTEAVFWPFHLFYRKLDRMLTFVQTKFRYNFADNQLLDSALRSAHRSQDDGMSDDGNRGLAHYGTLAMQLAETHDVIVENRMTLRKLPTVPRGHL
jgi:hypothetical protein